MSNFDPIRATKQAKPKDYDENWDRIFSPKKGGLKCADCEDRIFSWHRHDFKNCKCGKVFVDGGDDYMRVGWTDEDPEHIVYDPDIDDCKEGREWLEKNTK